MNLVFDACAIIAYLRDEAGAEVVEALITNTQHNCMIHAINLCEVYYDFLRSAGEAVAQEAINDCATIGLTIREDMDINFWQDVGKLKANHRLSLADCFALALTQRVQGQLVTSDHHEFDPIAVAKNGVIQFFR